MLRPGNRCPYVYVLAMWRSRNTSDWNRPNLGRPSAGSCHRRRGLQDDSTSGPCPGQFLRWPSSLSGPGIADDTAIRLIQSIRFEFHGPTS